MSGKQKTRVFYLNRIEVISIIFSEVNEVLEVECCSERCL